MNFHEHLYNGSRDTARKVLCIQVASPHHQNPAGNRPEFPHHPARSLFTVLLTDCVARFMLLAVYLLLNVINIFYSGFDIIYFC